VLSDPQSLPDGTSSDRQCQFISWLVHLQVFAQQKSYELRITGCKSRIPSEYMNFNS
jgi:hypothetical protein